MTDRPPNARITTSVPSRAEEADVNLLRHYAGILRRRSKWIGFGLIVGIVGAIVSAIVLHQQPPATRYYKATNTIAAPTNAAPDGSISTNTDPLQQALRVASSTQLFNAVAKELGMTQQQVVRQLSASPSANSGVNGVDITGIATNPQQALRISNIGTQQIQNMANDTVVSNINSQRASLQQSISLNTNKAALISAQINTKPANIDDLQTQLASVKAEITNDTTNLQQLPDPSNIPKLEILQHAIPIQINARGYTYRAEQNLNAQSPLDRSNATTDSPKFSETNLSQGLLSSIWLRVLICLIVGPILGVVVALIVEDWDDRVHKRDAIEKLTGLPVLAEIPKLGKDEVRKHHMVVLDETAGPAAERFRAARTAMQLMLELDTPNGQNAPVLLVTSPGPSEGKSTTAANIAATFADSGIRVLVIDADFRRPAIHRLLKPIPNLVSPSDPAETRVSGVQFLAGPSDHVHPDAAIATLREMVARWNNRYDLIILDTPPILTTNDAAELLDVADAVVVVLRAGQTRTEPAQRIASMLKRLNADVLGIVLNDCDRQEMYQYYDYRYDSYHKPNSTRTRKHSSSDTLD